MGQVTPQLLNTFAKWEMDLNFLFTIFLLKTSVPFPSACIYAELMFLMYTLNDDARPCSRLVLMVAGGQVHHAL